jgi:hypothetical protein
MPLLLSEDTEGRLCPGHSQVLLLFDDKISVLEIYPAVVFPKA